MWLFLGGYLDDLVGLIGLLCWFMFMVLWVVVAICLCFSDYSCCVVLDLPN